MRRSTRWTIGGGALAAALGLLLAGVPAHAGIGVGFQQAALAVAPGDTFVVQVVVPVAADSFNAFDAPIRFDPARLAFVATTPVSMQRGPLMTSACPSTFHDFRVTADSLKISLSLLCSDVFVAGPGVVYQVKFRALAPLGPTIVSLGPSVGFFNAGIRVKPVTASSLTVLVGYAGVPAETTPGVRLLAPYPNPSPGGRTTFEFELPAADAVRIEVLDVAGRRIATPADGRFAAGRHRVPAALDAPPGVYCARIVTASGAVRERSFTLVR